MPNPLRHLFHVTLSGERGAHEAEDFVGKCHLQVTDFYIYYLSNQNPVFPIIFFRVKYVFGPSSFSEIWN